MVLKTALHIPTRTPYSVQLDITDVCNLSCKMCPIHFVGMEKKHINFEIFRKIIDNLHGAEEISLVGLGEPLCHPRIHDAIAYCKSKGLIVKITSNGLLLNDDAKLKQLIFSGLDTLSISLDSLHDSPEGAHNNQRVLQYIGKLMTLKNEMSSTTPKIAIQSVLYKNREQDLYDIIEWSAQREIHRINVLRMHMYFDTDMERPGRKEEKKIYKQLALLREKHNIRIDCLQDQFFTGVKGLLYKYFKHFLRIDSHCTRLLNYPYITQDGDMIPCCVLPKHTFGNILQNDIRDIWHGEKINHFRKHHNNVTLCSKCDNWRIKQLV